MIARAKSLISFGRNNQDRSSRYKLESSSSMQYMVGQILMSELRDSYTDIEDRRLQLQRSRMSVRTGGADYSWLVSSKFAKSNVPNRERAELERLCEFVRPEETNTIVNYFRKRIESAQRGVDVVRIFRETVGEVLQGRPKPVEAGTWLAGRLRRSNTNRIDTLIKDGANGDTDQHGGKEKVDIDDDDEDDDEDSDQSGAAVDQQQQKYELEDDDGPATPEKWARSRFAIENDEENKPNSTTNVMELV